MMDAGGHWRNWVGNQSCIVRHKGAPESEAALSEMVREATSNGLNVRCAGSGHSFTPVALTSGLHLTLSKLQGLTNIDTARKRVSVHAGTTINTLGKALKANGLSMINQGDIDSQALAGALTTGTHGTGLTLGKWATGLRIQRLDSANPGIGRALLRHFVGYPLSFVTFGLGFLLATVTVHGRGLHDMIAGTVVVREGSL